MIGKWIRTGTYIELVGLVFHSCAAGNKTVTPKEKQENNMGEQTTDSVNHTSYKEYTQSTPKIGIDLGMLLLPQRTFIFRL